MRCMHVCVCVCHVCMCVWMYFSCECEDMKEHWLRGKQEVKRKKEKWKGVKMEYKKQPHPTNKTSTNSLKPVVAIKGPNHKQMIRQTDHVQLQNIWGKWVPSNANKMGQLHVYISGASEPFWTQTGWVQQQVLNDSVIIYSVCMCHLRR